MAPPFPTLSIQGQGAASADQLNTYVQIVQNFAQLRSFTPLNDMAVLCLGGAAEGDGDQGLFWYSSASTAADNGSTVIVPTGATKGAWLLLPPGSNSPGAFASLTVSGNSALAGNLTVGGTFGVTGVATFAADVLMTGTGEAQIPSGTTGQRSGSPAAGMIRYNTTLSQFEGYGSSWQPLAGTGVAQPPGGRLTLTSGVPVLSSTVTAATGVIYTPYLGNTVPQWNGSAWTSTVFAEISQSLSDTTNSPAAAVAGALYDLFVWFKSGVATLSRGPAWTNATTRSLALTRTLGFLTNSVSITNGPAAGDGFYVGTIMTDVSAATVTFAPQPAAASGGPTTGSGGGNSGAWIGLWNEFNRALASAEAQDSKSSWTYGTATWRSSDNSANNRVNFVVGNIEDSVSAQFSCAMQGGSGGIGYIGIGFNSATTPFGAVVGTAYATYGGATATASQAPSLGQNYIQALEFSNSVTNTFFGTGATGSPGQTHELSAQLRF